MFSCGCPSSLPLGTHREWNGGGEAAPRPGRFPSGRPAFCTGLLGNLVPSHFTPPRRHTLAGLSQFLQNLGSFTAPAPPRAESRYKSWGTLACSLRLKP